MDPAFLIVMVALLFLWTREIFPKPPPKPKVPEADLADALKAYLIAGVKIRPEEKGG
jgi:hypothetical protein